MLCDPGMEPFVDTTGQGVTVLMMITQRRMAKTMNSVAHRHKMELLEWRVHRLADWDQHRLLDSEQVLPFIALTRLRSGSRERARTILTLRRVTRVC